METPVPYQILADAVLALHLGVVVFVVGGLAFIVVGGFRRWPLARSLPFRVAHLAAIAVVVAQAWLGAICPLTTVESWLRVRARQTAYSGSFVEHWVGRLLYYDAPPWGFTVAYTLFGLAVLGAWWCFPPQRKAGDRS